MREERKWRKEKEKTEKVESKVGLGIVEEGWRRGGGRGGGGE